MTENLYKLIEKNETSFQITLADKEHPIFLAHFPGYPILPGFLLIEIAIEVLKDSPKTIKSAKFIAHSLPNDTLEYHYERKDTKTKIKVTNEKNEKVGEIVYE